MTSEFGIENPVAVTSHLLHEKLDNCVVGQPAVDCCQTNSDTFIHRLRQAEPGEFRGSSHASTVRSDRHIPLSLEITNGSETTFSDTRKQNSVNDTDALETIIEPLLERLTNSDCDHLLPNDEVPLKGKYRVGFKRFKGIGPTDESTGIPIASRTVSKT